MVAQCPALGSPWALDPVAGIAGVGGGFMGGADAVAINDQAVAEDQHYVTSYRMRAHVGQCWRVPPTPGSGDVPSVIPAVPGDLVLRYLVWPRVHALTLDFVVGVYVAGVSPAQTYIDCVDESTGLSVGNVTLAHATGIPPAIVWQTGFITPAPAMAAGTLYRLDVSLSSAAGGTADMVGFSCRERDLTLAQLRAL